MPEITEWSFAADAAKWITFHSQRLEASPFSEAKVEIKGAGSRKRSDLILFDREGRKALTGEIKLPDTREGQTPFNGSLVSDARRKARRVGAPYFFTWNVNRLVLWQTDLESEIRPPFDVALIRRSVELELAAGTKKNSRRIYPTFY